MSSPQILLLAFSLRDRLAAMSWLELVLWIGMASLTVALLVLMGTRWGQVRPVEKCVVLSIFAHILFIAYAYGTKLNFGDGWSLGSTVRVTLEDGYDDEADIFRAVDPNLEPVDSIPAVPQETTIEDPPQEPPVAEQPTTESPQPAPELLPTPEPPAAEPPALLAEPMPPAAESVAPALIAEAVELPADVPADTPEVVIESTPSMTPEVSPIPETAVPLETPQVEIAATPTTDRDAAIATPSPQEDVTVPVPESPETTYAVADSRRTESPRRPVDNQPLPESYRLRSAKNRLQLAIPFGATETSEAAVNAALVWLASVQSADGRWDASDFGAGRETKTLGQDRQGAGETADMGITGLALLAFLGAGKTHLEGEYRDTVQHGLEFVLRGQANDGNLAGPARLFEKMYCHGIASLAVGEAYALTGDPRLQSALKRAVAYSVASQHPTSGGWRYQPGDRGDMSQFGWQVMALRSAELGGLTIDDRTRSLMLKFLEDATSGKQKGLASYRAGERPSRTMTAEAIACRFFLQVPPNSTMAQEASDFIVQELPDNGQPNLYYWYYATLALYQDQGPAWQTWNESLQRRLVANQRRDGGLAGSWDTNDVWGGYGGRVYTTAMGALCLEVYYRYLPLYAQTETSRQAEARRGDKVTR